MAPRYVAAIVGGLLYCVWAPILQARGADVALTHVDVFTSGMEGYHTFRVPSIVRTNDGILHAFAQGGLTNSSDPGGTHIDMVYKRSVDGGQTWSPLVLVDRHPESNLNDLVADRTAASNSVALVDRTNNRLWLFDVRLENRQPGSFEYWSLYSDDSGLTWSTPQRIAVPKYETAGDDIYPNLGSGIQLTTGRLIVPSTQRIGGDGGTTRNFALYSDDHGTTWHAGGLVDVPANENQIVELANGHLLMSMRPAAGPLRLFAVSNDGGESWQPATQGFTSTQVMEGIERYTAAGEDGEIENRILHTIPAGSPLNVRSNIEIRTSYDEGQSFVNPRNIYRRFAAYSDLVNIDGDRVGVLWERGDTGNYQYLTYTTVNRAFLEAESRSGQIAYEPFNYSAGLLGRGLAGNGYNSTWHGDASLSDSSLASVGPLSLTYDGLPFEASGNHIDLNNGASLARSLGVPIELNSNRNTYLSLLISHEDDTTQGTGKDEFLQVQLLDSNVTSRLSFAAEGDGKLTIGDLGGTVTTPNDVLASNRTYLLVLKVASQDDSAADNFDQLFLKVFESGDAIPDADEGLAWTLTGTVEENDGAILDRVFIQSGTSANWRLDEMRIGTTFGAVASNVAPPIPNSVPGDVNQDGRIWGDGSGPAESDDVTAFIAGWLANTAGLTELEKVWLGDLNLSGKTDLADAFILHQALVAQGSAFPFKLLAVPETTTLGLLGLGVPLFPIANDILRGRSNR